jgi:cyclase
MLKLRVIPVLSFNGFALVKTKQFANPRMVGNPTQTAKVYNSRNVDELIFIDIFASRQKRKINLAIVKQVIDQCFMPVSIGGGITSIEDINDLLQIGADKVVIKTAALKDPEFIINAVKHFGSQCIVVAVDFIKEADKLKIYHYDKELQVDALEFIRKMQDCGAGELFINDVNNDGMMNGFDAAAIEAICREVKLPVIVSGGAGKPADFLAIANSRNVTGMSAASMFHFTQYTPFDIKYALHEQGYPVRLFDYHLAEEANK